MKHRFARAPLPLGRLLDIAIDVCQQHSMRLILRTPDGNTLTKDQLVSPTVFLAAIQNIPRYDPSYDFARTTHVRTARLGMIGTSVQKLLDSLVPKWQDSVAISLLLNTLAGLTCIGDKNEAVPRSFTSTNADILVSSTRYGRRAQSV